MVSILMLGDRKVGRELNLPYKLSMKMLTGAGRGGGGSAGDGRATLTAPAT